MLSRRTVLRRTASLVSVASSFSRGSETARDDNVRSILQRISAPAFPDRDFDIMKFGAERHGAELCTKSIQAAITACSAAGGGRVVIPHGTFITGAIQLADNVNLYVASGAILRFSNNPENYLPVVLTRFESTECMNYSPLIYAFSKRNIAVTGPGVLDGGADAEHWWPWKKSNSDSQALTAMGERDVPANQRIFGDGHALRPNFIQPYNCTNVLLKDFTMKNSPMWELNPVLCKNVIVDGVKIDSHGPNNDGCDPECCQDVLIQNCVFSTGDDCIAIKSGRNRDGRRVNVPCENIVIQNCKMQDGHGGVSIGSEVSGGIKNVYIRHCEMSSPRLERGLRIKTNSYRSGVIENVDFSDVTIGEVKQAAVEVDFFYEEGQGGPFAPSVKDIFVRNVTSKKSRYGVFFRGFANAPVTGVSIEHCNFAKAAEGNVLQNVKAVHIRDVTVNDEKLKSTN